ncbi:tyrosine-type recombinase/integrase [Paucibacter sp. DJ2R-2]|uniref:tyrosine-type recombinase/integrase n=1 Tax=Paucibacter sp. DJ2R-2 TaxID=2893558 RepID=UPI0021E5127A|nr:integrase family protein [Paucibacter sp. DJ2R-2]MCV2436887.1 integrase family protein [Paucibacter sp. DJ2R-2]
MSGLAPAPLALTKQLLALPVGAFITIEKLEQGGSLQVRRLSTGAVQFYWRYANEGRTHREPLGPYDPVSPPKKLEPTSRGLSIAAARERCRQLSLKHTRLQGVGGLREAKAIERRQYVADKAAEATRATHSLGKLLDDYVRHQATQGRVSAREAKNLFDLHVVKAWPTLAQTPASEITQDQVIDMLRRLTEQGKGRTSNKLRAYLRAAFQCAVDVRVTATIPVAFKAYALQANPAAQTRRDGRFDGADKRPLSAEELRTYWKLIEKLPGLRGRCLRMHLLTGGQRIEQLVRLRWADVRADSITIHDTKGRPGRGPRAHTVPIIKPAVRDLQGFERVGDHVFSTTKGAKPISGTTLSGWAAQAVGDAIKGFQLKRVRSGVETLLAANRISREIRGHVQSHGLTGIQARHYDGHDYMQEKREALELLAGELTGGATRSKAAKPRREAASASLCTTR